MAAFIRSDDAGQTWKLADNESRIWGRGWYFGGVTVDPKNADVLYVMNTSTYRSTDGGQSFTAIKGAPGGDDYHTLWIEPDDPNRMILGSDQGVVVSVDGAQTWSSWYNQPTAQFYHVAVDNRFPYWVYGAQQDSGAAGTTSRSRHRGISFARLVAAWSRRRERLYRAGPAPHRHSFRRHSDARKCFHRRDQRTSRPSSRIPAITGTHGRSRSFFRRPIRTRFISARKCCSRRATAARVGRSSARI